MDFLAAYIVRRLLAFIPTIIVVAMLVFLMTYLVPGDATATMLGPEATQEDIQLTRERLGLDRPFHERFLEWSGNAIRGDLGDSIFLNQPVTTALIERLPVTLSLAAFAWFVSGVIGITVGVIASVRHGRPADWGLMFMAIIGLSVPVFWLALNMIFLFSVRLGWLPTGGYVPLTENPVEYMKHLLLPGIVLGLAHTAVIARMTRSSMLEVLRQDYVRTAQAKGLKAKTVVMRHALRNALIPIITVLGISAGELLSGSVITETVFNLPGVGRLVIDGVRRRDFPVIQGGILIITVGYLFINLLVDLVYAWVDPRVHYS